MKENELTIEIPKGKIVDWEESKKLNKIVLKDKQLTYEDICEKLFKNEEYFYTNGGGGIHPANSSTSYYSPNNATTKHQLECLLAKNKLANVAKYLNGEWKPKSGDVVCEFVLEGSNRNLVFPLFSWEVYHCYFPQFVFKDAETAEQAIEILGEETIKLALEPLGI